VSDPLGIPPTLDAHCEAPPPPLLLLLLEQAYEAAATALSATMVKVLMLMLIDRFLRLDRDTNADESAAEARRRSILSDTARGYWQVSSL